MYKSCAIKHSHFVCHVCFDLFRIESNLGLQFSLEFNKTNIPDVEKQIFQTSITEIRRLVCNADHLIKQHYVQSTAGSRVLDTILADTLAVDDYIYIPGGHWIPAKMPLRWKVGIYSEIFTMK